VGCGGMILGTQDGRSWPSRHCHHERVLREPESLYTVWRPFCRPTSAAHGRPCTAVCCLKGAASLSPQTHPHLWHPPHCSLQRPNKKPAKRTQAAPPSAAHTLHLAISLHCPSLVLVCSSCSIARAGTVLRPTQFLLGTAVTPPLTTALVAPHGAAATTVALPPAVAPGPLSTPILPAASVPSYASAATGSVLSTASLAQAAPLVAQAAAAAAAPAARGSSSPAALSITSLVSSPNVPFPAATPVAVPPVPPGEPGAAGSATRPIEVGEDSPGPTTAPPPPLPPPARALPQGPPPDIVDSGVSVTTPAPSPGPPTAAAPISPPTAVASPAAPAQMSALPGMAAVLGAPLGAMRATTAPTLLGFSGTGGSGSSGATASAALTPVAVPPPLPLATFHAPPPPLPAATIAPRPVSAARSPQSATSSLAVIPGASARSIPHGIASLSTTFQIQPARSASNATAAAEAEQAMTHKIHAEMLAQKHCALQLLQQHQQQQVQRATQLAALLQQRGLPASVAAVQAQGWMLQSMAAMGPAPIQGQAPTPSAVASPQYAYLTPQSTGGQLLVQQLPPAQALQLPPQGPTALLPAGTPIQLTLPQAQLAGGSPGTSGSGTGTSVSAGTGAGAATLGPSMGTLSVGAVTSGLPVVTTSQAHSPPPTSSAASRTWNTAPPAPASAPEGSVGVEGLRGRGARAMARGPRGPRGALSRGTRGGRGGRGRGLLTRVGAPDAAADDPALLTALALPTADESADAVLFREALGGTAEDDEAAALAAAAEAPWWAAADEGDDGATISPAASAPGDVSSGAADRDAKRGGETRTANNGDDDTGDEDFVPGEATSHDTWLAQHHRRGVRGRRAGIQLAKRGGYRGGNSDSGGDGSANVSAAAPSGDNAASTAASASVVDLENDDASVSGPITAAAAPASTGTSPPSPAAVPGALSANATACDVLAAAEAALVGEHLPPLSPPHSPDEPLGGPGDMLARAANTGSTATSAAAAAAAADAPMTDILAASPRSPLTRAAVVAETASAAASAMVETPVTAPFESPTAQEARATATPTTAAPALSPEQPAHPTIPDADSGNPPPTSAEDSRTGQSLHADAAGISSNGGGGSGGSTGEGGGTGDDVVVSVEVVEGGGVASGGAPSPQWLAGRPTDRSHAEGNAHTTGRTGAGRTPTTTGDRAGAPTPLRAPAARPQRTRSTRASQTLRPPRTDGEAAHTPSRENTSPHSPLPSALSPPPPPLPAGTTSPSPPPPPPQPSGGDSTATAVAATTGLSPDVRGASQHARGRRRSIEGDEAVAGVTGSPIRPASATPTVGENGRAAMLRLPDPPAWPASPVGSRPIRRSLRHTLSPA